MRRASIEVKIGRSTWPILSKRNITKVWMVSENGVRNDLHTRSNNLCILILDLLNALNGPKFVLKRILYGPRSTPPRHIVLLSQACIISQKCICKSVHTKFFEPVAPIKLSLRFGEAATWQWAGCVMPESMCWTCLIVWYRSGNGSTRQYYSHICSRYYACTTKMHYRTNMASLVDRQCSAYLPGIWFSQTTKVGARRNDRQSDLQGQERVQTTCSPSSRHDHRISARSYISAVSDIIMLQSYRWITTPSRGPQIEPTYAVWSTYPIRSREKSKQKNGLTYTAQSPSSAIHHGSSQ
ncbi:hypothetical protein V8F33_001883 [Rhypophila sp. PSN 637]